MLSICSSVYLSLPLTVTLLILTEKRTAPFICLAVWVVLGFIFYFSNKKHWISLPEEKVRENVLGRKDIAVFFKK